MYPRNATSPPRLAIGPVVQISDGAVQTSGVAVKVIPQGGTEASGAGTVAYSADGAVLYTPTQGETDYVAVVFVASKTGCIPATLTVVMSASNTPGYAGLDWSKVGNATSTVALTGTTISTSQVVASVTAAVTVGTNNDKTGYSLTQAFPANFAALGINSSGHVSRVTLVDTTTVNSDMRGTDNALLAASYTAPPSAATNATAVRSELSTELARIDATIGSRSTLTAGGVRTELATELGRIDATISSRLATSGYTAPDNTSITAIKSVTDKLNTGLVLDGAVYQFTVNMLENAPGGAGGGSATIENQELILANLDNITGAVSAAVARLQLETQITGFPATICRGSDYDSTLESEIRLQLLDLNNDPITEIGGTPVDEITWLFGLGTDRQPRLVEGACSWDDTTDELVIELAATDTSTTPLGSVTWQIGAQIGELVRWLGGGTTRIVERQFTV